MSEWINTRLNLRYHWKAVLIWGLGIGGALVLVFWTMSGRAEAWTSDTTYQPFPNGEATIIIHQFCLSAWCPVSPGEWETMIRDTVQKWDAAGSNFVFHTRRARPTDDPCRLGVGEVAFIWTDGQRKCSEDFPLPPYHGGVKGVVPAILGQRAARVYLYAARSSADEFEIKLLAPFILLHEFGHVLGLGHPNEVGQTVEAVMNSGVPDDINFRNPQLRPDDIAGVRALYGARTATPTTPDPTPPMRGFLENPSPGTHASGIGVISGWVCEAVHRPTNIEGKDTTAQVVVQIVGPSRGRPNFVVAQAVVPYGGDRQDTVGVCGDTNNGFGLLVNWSNLEDGEHRIEVYVGGADQWHELGRSTFTVTTLGEPFIRGLEGEYVLEDFPYPGQSVVVEWEQSLQNFVITEHHQ